MISGFLFYYAKMPRSQFQFVKERFPRQPQVILRTPTGYNTLQLNSVTIRPEIAADSTGKDSALHRTTLLPHQKMPVAGPLLLYF